MLERLKNEPALLAAALVAVLNLTLGRDSGLEASAVESGLVMLLGAVLRSKVVPARLVEFPEDECENCPVGGCEDCP